MEFKALTNYLSLEKEAKDFLRAVCERLVKEVFERDEEVLLLPGEIVEEERYVVWEMMTTEGPEPLLSLEPDEEESDEKFEDEEFEEDPGEEESEDKRLTCQVGVYFWVAEEGPVASVYALADGGTIRSRWSLVRKIAERLKGKIHLLNEEWTEDEVEVERFLLSEYEDVDELVEDLAERILETAEEITELI